MSLAGKLLEPAETLSLGERIVEAARLAVAVHLYESLSNTENYGRRVVIGGAGPHSPAPRGGPATDGDRAHPQPRFADDGEAAE